MLAHFMNRRFHKINKESDLENFTNGKYCFTFVVGKQNELVTQPRQQPTAEFITLCLFTEE